MNPSDPSIHPGTFIREQMYMWNNIWLNQNDDEELSRTFCKSIPFKPILESEVKTDIFLIDS